ncbi:hemolysin family protein [Urbifossiella limnaea]|uniref:Hemolysin C n=1 Tax=Urbifossiella limnaea TaxID=2528023 RepID=A0A517XZ89_9BACT|nr:hemolysin family protein [Urbifossiella limnaea]QDU22778.1 Hemolysin C [Urbifossiella limnaea]
MWGVELLVMAGMIAFNSVFAAFEIALASISNARLHSLEAAKRAGATAARYMKENLEGSLAGVQLGITLVGAIAAAVGGAGAEEQLAPTLEGSLGISSGTAEVMSIALVVAPLTVVTIIFGELIPKVFALRNKELVCLRLSPPMKLFVTGVWPVVWVLENATTGLMSLVERRLKAPGGPASKSEAAELQELRASVALARTSRLIGVQEERIILGAAALSHRPIRDVMLPAAAISTLDATAGIADALVAAHLDMHTRFPVTEAPGDPNQIVGYVNFKDIVAHARLAPNDPTLRGVVRSIPSVPADMLVSDVLARLTRESTHIALVRDAAGAVVGMVTLEDIIEELVGDIEDEFDRLPGSLAKAGAGWVVGGGVTPDRLKATTGIDLPPGPGGEPPRHLSEWVLARLGGVVRGGEVVDADGVRVLVRKVRRQKVQEAQVEARGG